MGRFPVQSGRAVLLSLLLLGSAAASVADRGRAESTGVEVVYLANEGFLIRSDDRAVLIDALFGDGIRGYPSVPGETRLEMERGGSPFEQVELVLATHHHGDHFDAAAVSRFLDRHPEALFVSTEQAVERLTALMSEDSPVRGRIRAATPGAGRPVTLEHAGVKIEVVALHHGHGMNPPVQNLGFLVEIDGVKLLHVGDTEVTPEEFRESGAAERDVDVALLSYWTLDSLGSLVGASRSVAMHLPDPGAPSGYFAPFGDDLSELVETLTRQHPEAFIPTRAMESLRVPTCPVRQRDSGRASLQKAEPAGR